MGGPDTSMERRRFVTLAGGAALAAALAGCSSLAATTVRPRDGVVRLSLRNHPGLSRPGGFLKIRDEDSGRLLYVLALDEGEPAVLSPICTHQQCTVDVEGTHLVCPCHGSTYTRTGRVVRGPAQEPLTRLPAQIDDGMLIIQVGGGS